VQANYNGFSSHNSQAAASTLCTTQWLEKDGVFVVHVTAGTALNVVTSFTGVTGSPVYSVDAIIEQLQ
jgi:hypothetical protein